MTALPCPLPSPAPSLDQLAHLASPPCPPLACALPAEGDLLSDQANSVKECAEYVSQLRRVGSGLGVFQFDQQLGAA